MSRTISSSTVSPATPPPTTTTLGGATNPNQGTREFPITIAILLVCLLPLIIWIIFVITAFSVPRFHVNCASISLHNYSINNNFITANWNLGISVRNPSIGYAIKYHDFDVKLNCFTRYLPDTTLANYSSGTVVPGFHQGSRATTLVNDHVLINATLPYYAIRTVEDLEFEVIIEVKFKSSVNFNLRALKMDALCNDMKIGILSNATYGYLIGGRKSCSTKFGNFKYNS